MRVGKTTVSNAQVTMCVYLQDAEFSVLLSYCLKITEWRAVISAENANQLSTAQQAFSLIINPLVEVSAPLINIFQRLSHELVVFHFLTAGNIVDVKFSLLAQVVTLH